MIALRVRFLELATTDLEELRRYLVSEGVGDPQAMIRRIVTATERLAVLPKSCPIARDPRLALRGYRVLRCGRYLVFYKIIGRTVRIDRVLHERRAYAGLF